MTTDHLNYTSPQNSANFSYTPSGVTGWQPYKPTTVGTNGVHSYYGTYDQDGGVAEFTEESVLLRAPSLTGSGYEFGFAKGVRGGTFAISPTTYTDLTEGDLKTASVRINKNGSDVGFRIGSIYTTETYTGFSGVAGSRDLTVDKNTYNQLHMDHNAVVSGSGLVQNTHVNTVNYNAVTQRYEIGLSTSLSDTIDGSDSVTFTISNPAHMPHMTFVGNPSNSPKDPFGSSIGRVSNSYNIGKFSVTHEDWIEFLREVYVLRDGIDYNVPVSGTTPELPPPPVPPLPPPPPPPPPPPGPYIQNHNTEGTRLLNAREDVLGLYNDNMKNLSGIDKETGEWILKDPRMAKKPLQHIDWLSAAKYCNWLHNRSFGHLGVNNRYGWIMDGAYDLKNVVSAVNRSAGARYFIPNKHEWFKAAYYNPGGTDPYNRTYIPQSAGYSRYATMSDIQPVSQSRINKYGDASQIYDGGLFDRNTIEQMLNPYNDTLRWALQKAADRWDNVITLINDYRYQHPDLRYDSPKRYLDIKGDYEQTYDEPWYGIKLKELNIYTDTSRDVIASCAPIEYATSECETSIYGFRYMPASFKLNINSVYLSGQFALSPDSWIDVMTHELGHALGIGTIWSLNFSQNRVPWSCGPVGNLSSGGYDSTDLFGTDAFINSSKAYNRLVGDGIERRLVPLADAAHFRATYRDDTQSNDGLEYPGMSNEIMQPTLLRGAKITPFTVAHMIDLGYYPHKNYENAEGAIVFDNNPSAQSSSVEIIGHCSCNGTCNR